MERPGNDEQAIAAGIWEARAEDAEIADDIARMIAARYHGGQASAFYSFVSTGAIDPERLQAEFVGTYNGSAMMPRDREWLDFLGTYWLQAGERGPVDGWLELWRES
jgi:hypothetical protein